MNTAIYIPMLALVTFLFTGAVRAATQRSLDSPVLDSTSARLLILAAVFLGAAWGVALGSWLAGI